MEQRRVLLMRMVSTVLGTGDKDKHTPVRSPVEYIKNIDPCI